MLKMICRVSKKVAKISIWIALILLIFSTAMVAMFSKIYNIFLKKAIALTEGSVMTHAWTDIPLPIYEKLYFFNITNKDKFLEGSEPLNVSEVGPYTYKGKWIKDYLAWNPNNTVSYRETRYFFFAPDMSIGPEEDEIYTLNGPLITASSIAESYGIFERTFLSILLGLFGEEIVIKRKIKELAYEGYGDSIMKYAKFIETDIPFQNGIFSWLYGKNATNDGLFNVYTGADDLMKINVLDRWNGKERLNFWKGNSCNMLNGTSGETGPPGQDIYESYSFFQSIFCRTLNFKYAGVTNHYGVDAKRFRSDYSVFANSTDNPDNYCYEVQRQRPSGILDVSSCQFGAPVFISFPHFLYSDPSYFDGVFGLNPNEKDHESHLDVELETGLTIDLVIRFQINVELKKVNGIFQTYSPSKGVLPVFWAEVSVQMTEELADLLTSYTKNLKIMAYAVFGGIMVISVTIMVVCLFITCSHNNNDVPLLGAVKDEYSEYYRDDISSENRETDEANDDHETFTDSSKLKKKNAEGRK